MFSRSKRFTNTVESTPAVGQYDISKASCANAGSVHFPKDKRFKESGITNDANLLDISNCSTTSTTSNGPLNHGVFVTPAKKTCGKVKSKGPMQSVSNVELNKLSAKIAELEKEIEKLRAENAVLQKLQDCELNDGERLMMESNLTALKEEVDKLRKQIEDEMERNKELVYQQSNYECSLRTMQADLELANSQVIALQQQINYLEKTNADITESREELESQCTRLHGMNIALQEEKLAFQDRLDETETKWKNACSAKEELSADLLSCKKRHQYEIETVEQSLKEKLMTVEELTEERKSLEGTVESYENKICNLKLEMDESLKNQTEIVNKLKIEKETLVVSLENLKNEHEQARQEMQQLQEVITRKEELNLANLRKCQNLEDQIVSLQQSQKVEVELLANELKLTKTNLEETKDECKTKGNTLQEMQTKYKNVCQAHEQLQHDLKVVKEDKRNVDNEIVEAQKLISQLQNNESEQGEVAETLITKLEMCNATISHLNKMNVEYQDTIEAQSRKVQNVQESLETLTKKCENHLALSQQGRDAEVKGLTEELELSKASLMKMKREFERTNEALKEMTQKYDDLCHHSRQLENNLQSTTQEKIMLERQLTQIQTNVDALRQKEKEQMLMVKILQGKVEALKENETVQTDLTQHNRNEMEKLKEQLQRMQEENSSLGAAQEKANKLKQEFGRRLIEAQKNLSQKEMELQNQRKDFEKLRIKYEGQDSWQRKFEELEEKIAPFQEQLDAYELEKQALLNRNTESQSEIDKLGQQYARLLGHQNQKQKIRHVQKLKDENTSLKKEVGKLREEIDKEKFDKKRLEGKLAKATGAKRFDPSLAFKHSVLENKENTPLKQHP